MKLLGLVLKGFGSLSNVSLRRAADSPGLALFRSSLTQEDGFCLTLEMLCDPILAKISVEGCPSVFIATVTNRIIGVTRK